MTKNLNTTLSTLLNTFEIINNAFKNHADPILDGYSITDMHCIECIGKIEYSNVTKISQALNLTRSCISKIVKKLIHKEAIVSYVREDNKKEIYYKLTDLGKKVFWAHEKIHEEWNNKDIEFFRRYKAEEVSFAIDFIQKYSEHLMNSIKDFEGSE